MIRVENQVFFLEGNSYSYVFRINDANMPEHLHYGAKLFHGDAQAMVCRPNPGWGSSVMYNEQVCLDVLPLEWSGSGRGDYRESPVEILAGGLPVPGEFVYDSHEIVEGSLPMIGGLPQAMDGQQTLILTLKHPMGVLLKLCYTVFPMALVRRTVLVNPLEQPVTVRKLMSFCVDLPGQYEMLSFHGNWNAEMRLHRQPVSGDRVVNESTTGFSSALHQPGFLLAEQGTGEDHGRAYGFNLIWSGNHYSAAQRSFQGLTRVMQGIGTANFSRDVEPGTTFETPEAVLTWSDGGLNGLSACFHAFVNSHIVPKTWQFRQRPILYNSWEGCGMDFTHGRLLDLAKRAKKLGCELFVLDDGWFGDRNHDRAGLGDYVVNKKKLPKGLKGLAEDVNAIGLEFGLWFEPECVNEDSALYRTHPDWVLEDGLPRVYGRNQLHLDLTKGEVRDYIVENVSRILDSANISYVKWDMNRHSVALGDRAYDYILGLYDVLRRIFGPRPQILLESRSSGGNRFDLGMLCFSPQIWCSDDTDPIERLDIQQSLSYLYPQSTFGAHVSAAPHSMTLRNTPLSTRGNVSFFGCLGYELDLKHLLPTEEKEIVSQVLFYRAHRKTFQFGALRRLWAPEGVAWQVSGEDAVLAGLFHRLNHAAPGYEQLRLQQLKGEKKYHLISREQLLRVGQYGSLIKYVSPVALDPNGLVLRTADRHFPMKDGREDMTVSGTALMSGVMLSQRFTGAGYNPNGRNQGDFCSNVYEITEVTAE